MALPRPRIPPSIAPEPALLVGALRLMVAVEDLPEGATGVLHVGPHGVLLLESRRICWAAAVGMEPRFAELLKQELQVELSRAQFDDLWRQCREDGAQFTSTLLKAGVVTEGSLRAAFFSQTVEATAHLARSGPGSEYFVPHARGRYNARFTFHPAEIIAALGARTNRALTVDATRVLEETLVNDTGGCAFVRDGGTSLPVVISAAGDAPLRVADMLALCGWASALFDVTTVFDPDVRVAAGTWSGFGCVVAWRVGQVQFAALSPNRAGATRIVAKLDSTVFGTTK
jgi:hypothetical protein